MFRGRGKVGVMNILDIVFAAFLLIFFWVGFSRGFVATAYRFVSLALSLALTNAIYPRVKDFLRGLDFAFNFAKETVAQSLPLSELLSGKADELKFIEKLPVPWFLRASLIENNNPEVYRALDVSRFEDYLHSFAADVIIGVFSFLLTFIIVFIITRLIGEALNIASSLPVIRVFDKLGGIAAGLCMGLAALWILMSVSALFVFREEYSWYVEALEASRFARLFYEINPILDALLKFP
jgi:uncharacterized membrane protein required for colicin V production